MFRDYKHRGDVFAAAVKALWRREPDLRLRAQRAERGVRPLARLGGAAARGDRPGDGVLGVDRDRGGEPLHRAATPRGSWCGTALTSRVALAAAITVFLIPARFWQKAAPWLFLAGLALLVLVLMPGFGREVNGARRWLDLPGFGFQPSEAMKLAVVLYAADYTARKHAVLKSFQRGLLPMLAVMLLVSWLLLREPDFGALVVIAVISFSILFLGGMNGRHFAALRRHARRRLRAARAHLALPHAAHLRLHGPVVRSLRQGLPAVARADRLRPRRMARRRPGRERREAASTCPRRTPTSCSR